MESHKIEQLLKKYFEATTTVSEEKALRTYFSQDKVAEHLERYTPMFRYFSDAKEEEFNKKVRLAPDVRVLKRPWMGWVAAAAVVLLSVGVYFNLDTFSSAGQLPSDGSLSATESLEEEYTQEEIASAQEALSLLAINFNKGTEQLSYLQEFEKNTDRFLIGE
ncbi:MAG TPA: hypothetical protein VFM69_11450 [Pricia sp.]|nr:hypothetical protein [Pricia sp.]